MTPSQGMGGETAQTARPTTSKWSGKSQLISLQAIAGNPTPQIPAPPPVPSPIVPQLRGTSET